MTEVVPVLPPSALEAAGAVVTETSLTLTDPELLWEDYEKLGRFLGQMNRACAWWTADLILHGESIFGEYYAQIEDSLGLAPQTISNRCSVARRIPPNRRRAALAFGVHAEVAYLEPQERDLWLDRAERGRWTRAKLREEMRAIRGISQDSLGDLAVTGKIDDSPHAESHEELTNGEPAAVALRGLLGEPVASPGSFFCPHCGVEITDVDVSEE